MKKYDRLIFVSNSDTCRGPMAEAILKSKFLLSELEVESRGLVVLFPEPVNQKAEAILASHGLTMKDHTAKNYTKNNLKKSGMLSNTIEEACHFKIIFLF